MKLVSKETIVRGGGGCWPGGGGGGGALSSTHKNICVYRVRAGGEDVKQEPLVAVDPVGLQ